MSKFRVVHYINQFFAGIGGEEQAHIKPEIKEGSFGPGLAFEKSFGDEAEIVATVICGDSYFNENIDAATNEILKMVEKFKPDLFISGPGFNAGRYGVACGAIAKAVHEKLEIPVLTGLYEENPGVDMYRKSVYIVPTRNSAAGMRNAVSKMVPFALKLAKNEEIKTPKEDGYFSRGIRKNVFAEEIGAKRAVDMLLKKMKGEEFETEFPMPSFDRVEIANPIKDLKNATIALVTSGGIVPKNNPDKIESSSASKYGKYSIEGVDDLTDETHETAHGGYDPVYANQDSDRVLPVDVLRFFEKEGKIGKLYPYFYSTTGNGTAVASSKQFATEIGSELKEAGVDGVILTST